jgi:hypothetical protein
MPSLSHFGIASAAFNACFANTFPAHALTTCTWGDKSATKTILLLGDSQAAQWLPAMNQLGIADKMKVFFVAHSGCPSYSFLEPTEPGSANTSCRTFSQDELNFARTLKPTIIISICGDSLSDSYPAEDEISWYKDLVDQFKKLNSHVILFGATPWLYQVTVTGPDYLDPNKCITIETSSLENCDPPANASPGLVARIVSATELVTFFDVDPLFCTSVRCPVIVGDTSGSHLVLFNYSHVSNTYFDWIAPAFESLVTFALDPALDKKQSALSIVGDPTQIVESGSVAMSTSGGSGNGLVTYSTTGGGCLIRFAVLSAPSGSDCTVTAAKSASGQYAITFSKPVKIQFSS